MYTLHETFNGYIISRHRTLLNAVRAKRKHANGICRREGDNAYVTYAISDCKGDWVAYPDRLAAEWTLDQQ